MSTKYSVQITNFAEKHYLKRLQKKRYKNAFDVPWSAFLFMLQRFDLMTQKENTNPISGFENNVVIYKTEFKILPKESTKTSGNRCIVALYKDEMVVKILFVYDKSDIKGSHETAWFKKIIKDNYTEYKDLL